MKVEKKSYLGIDVGATNMKYVCISQKGETMLESSVPTEKDKYPALLEQIKTVFRDVQTDSDITLCGTGIVVPGFIDFKDRKVFSSPNLHILNGRRIWKDFETVLDSTDFVIDNDANGAAYGEFGFRRKSEPGLNHLVFLTLGSGVGGGVINNSDLLHGSRGYGAELGHIKIYDNGRPCGCGASGCAEAYISNNGIVETFLEMSKKSAQNDSQEKHAIKDLSAKKIAGLAEAGYPPAIEAMNITGKRLGLLISILINIFNPQIIAVGGGIMNSAGLLLPQAVEEARRRTIECAFSSARIEKALLGAEAGAYGAAALARDKLE
jgi:glucokinase